MHHPPPRRRRRHLAAFLSVFALVATVLGVAPAAQADFGRPAQPVDPMSKIEQDVFDDLQTKNMSDYWVRFAADADTGRAATVEDWTARGQFVVDELKSTAQHSQATARKVLSQHDITYESYWITNAILVRDGDRALAAELAELDAVEQIRAPRTYMRPDPVEAKPSGNVSQAVEWGVANINADDVWSDYGVTGEGIVVANIDSGVDYDHPALAGSYRGDNGDGTFDHDYNWFDATGTSDEPFDGDLGNSHGTHTMGTMVGDDGAGNQIGVAPGARWIAANGCHTCSDAHLIASGEWMLAPTDVAGENADVSKRPHIINNSWGSRFPSNDPFMEDILTEWANAGIFGVWSNGNSGSACETSGSPGSRTLNYSVGAYDSSNNIAGFSARGPGQDGEIKPNIAAPGDNIRSSIDDGEYNAISGTSMAAPHVAGSIALLWSAAPGLIGEIGDTRELLNETAIDTADDQCGGTPEDNNVWGEGRLDALALLDAAPTGDVGVLSGTVTDAEGAAVPAATISVTGPLARDTATAEDGTYALTLPVGAYDVTVSAFGYDTATLTADITAEGTTTVDVTLQHAESFAVSGTVSDELSGNSLAGATVTIEETAIPPATTDEHGLYTFDAVPAGTYEVSVRAGVCNAATTQDLTVQGATTLDVALTKLTDEYGYFCSTGPSVYAEGDTLVDLSGDEATAEVALPFDFPLYGESYDTAYLSTNGHLNFLERVTDFSNSRLPDSTTPNAALYPFWDDFNITDGAVYTGATDDGFVIEYRNAHFYGRDSEAVDFSVTLRENGTITFAYRNLDPAVERELGSSATVGIENAEGTDAWQYSFNEPVLSDDTAITFALPPNGFVAGTVTDANDGLPVAGAAVQALDADGNVVREATTGDDGSYGMQLFVGAYTVQAVKSGYVTGSDDVLIDVDGESNTVDFDLATGVADIDTGPLSWTITEGQSRSAEVTVTNTGSADLTWEIGELSRGGGRQKVPSPDRETAAAADPDARTALGRYSEEQLEDLASRELTPTDTGDVLAQWQAEGLSVAWGVGYDGDVWVSDPDSITNHQFSTDGTPGEVFPGNWGGTWNGDMAQDTSTGAMCQVNVGGDNAIHCFDQADGSEQYVISGPEWTAISQRGLAYNPTDDTFYIGGWNEGVIYTVAGQSHDEPGATLAQCSTEDASIAGLAYNPTADVIWMVNSSLTTYVYQLSPETCATISTIAFPEQGSGPGAGLDMDATGALWATSQLTNTTYLIDSGVPHVSDLPWLNADPASGTLAPGESATVTVTVDSTGLEAGVYEATLMVDTDAGRVPTAQLPVSLLVPAYRTGVNAGGSEYADTLEDVWSADQTYAAGSWGWVGQRAEAGTTDASIGGTDDEALFQSRRSGIFGYRFDGVPAGTYEIELGFAEFEQDKLPGRRVFDVSVNGDYVLVQHDVAAEVRGLWADEHTVVVEHEGGPLTVDLHDRFGYELPIINALRVTDRPDL